jgi:integration host factor subunit beta
MNKSELIARLAGRHPSISHDDTEGVVTTVLASIGKALSKKQRVELRGFGCFSIRDRPAHMGRNPKTGDAIAVLHKRVVHFRSSHPLRKRMNNIAFSRDSSNESTVPPEISDASFPD